MKPMVGVLSSRQKAGGTDQQSLPWNAAFSVTRWHYTEGKSFLWTQQLTGKLENHRRIGPEYPEIYLPPALPEVAWVYQESLQREMVSLLSEAIMYWDSAAEVTSVQL